MRPTTPHGAPDPSYCDMDAEGYADHRPVVATFEIMP